MIYTDRIHIISDKSINELHSFARVIGLHWCWFDSNHKHPHYDFPKSKSGGISRNQLIEDSITIGAIEVTTRELVEIINRNK